MENPVVNVFISSFNRVDYLKQAVESVLNQSYPYIRIIIVDDASTDESPIIAKKFEKKYPDKVIAICKKSNKGVCDSLNIALKYCSSCEYFALLADDDLWHPNKLEKQMIIFKKNKNIGVVITEAKIIDVNGIDTGKYFHDIYSYKNELDDDVARYIFLRGNFICSASAVVSYEALQTFDSYIPNQIGYLTDLFMWVFITSKFKLYYLKEPLTYYRIHTNNVSKNQIDRSWEIYNLTIFSYSNNINIKKIISEVEYRWRVFGILNSIIKSSIKYLNIPSLFIALREYWRHRMFKEIVKKISYFISK